MRLFISIISILLYLSFDAQTNPKRERVNGYRKKNGTYVATHNRTQKNKTERDNWSSKPNRNPDTGKKGYKRAKK